MLTTAVRLQSTTMTPLPLYKGRAAESGDDVRIDSIISGSEHGIAVMNVAGGLDPDVNAGEPNYTPLHWAAVRG